MKNQFEQQVEEIFKDYNITQYRENPSKKKKIVPWVEFWITSEESSMNLRLAKLNLLFELFKTEDISLTGGDLAAASHQYFSDFSNPGIYVCAENVVFSKSKRK